MDVTYNPRRSDLGALLTDPRIGAVVGAVAQEIAAAAQAFAPSHTGELRASIHVETTDRGGVKGDRIAATVVASAPHAAAAEFGNSLTPRGNFYLYRALGTV